MANSAYTDTVQKVYIAYYGRAADPLGLAYWEDQLTANDGDLAAIMNSFGTSPEATTLFGSLTNTIKVKTLYTQIFGRDADDGGLEYYTAQLTAGTMTAVSIAQNILDGASGSDATIITNKLAVAKAFTAAIDSDVKVPAYAGDTAASSARNMLATVGESTDIESFNINTTVESLVSMAAPAATAAYNSAAVNFDAAAAVFNAAKATATASEKAAAAAKWSEVSSTAADGYQVNIDYEGKIDGIAFDGGTAKGYDLVLGSDTMISGFEEGIVGMQAGQDKDITVTFPNTYHKAELADKEAVFTITANTVRKAIANDVVLLTASQAAAAIAVTDATAVSTAALAVSAAAATLTITSAATLSTADDATASIAISQTAAVTASAATAAASAAAVKIAAADALATALAIAEPIKTAAFDAALVDYYAAATAFNTASAAAKVSKAVAETASETVTDVELSMAFETAAAVAVTDAVAVSSKALIASNAAAKLTTTSAATSSVVDDVAAIKAISETDSVTASAAIAASAAAAIKTTADAALVTALNNAESIRTAAFDAAFVEYNTAAVAFNAALATAKVSKAAAEAAADAYAGPQTLIVTASGGNYIISDQANKALTFKSGLTYTFDLSDSSLSAHPLRLSVVSDGTLNKGSEYSTGVTVTGTQGQVGASIAILVTDSAPGNLYYYCSNHAGMGAAIGVSEYNLNDVALATASQTAAAIAVTDAAAVSTAALDASNAAATLTTTSAATSSTADDATASKAIAETAAVTTTAATASATVATMKIAADVALTNSTKAITAASKGLTNEIIAGGSGIDAETVINMLEIVGINDTETPFSHEFGWII
jgi:FKBP-type peptidyl-prolyl cis-trans isomerase